jgi:hypothetical protein
VSNVKVTLKASDRDEDTASAVRNILDEKKSSFGLRTSMSSKRKEKEKVEKTP